MNNPEILARNGTQDEEQQIKNTRQYVYSQAKKYKIK
jgi:hypothetical protein